MITKDEVTQFFCMANKSREVHNKFVKVNGLLPRNQDGRCSYHRSERMTDSEVIATLTLFHFSGYRYLKHIYLEYAYKRQITGVNYACFLTLPLPLFYRKLHNSESICLSLLVLCVYCCLITPIYWKSVKQ